jgi:hypothetical protein
MRNMSSVLTPTMAQNLAINECGNGFGRSYRLYARSGSSSLPAMSSLVRPAPTRRLAVTLQNKRSNTSLAHGISMWPIDQVRYFGSFFTVSTGEGRLIRSPRDLAALNAVGSPQRLAEVWSFDPQLACVTYNDFARR